MSKKRKTRSYPHLKAQKAGKEQDEYVCFFCNTVQKKNQGHHIMFYSENGDASVGNIITLCPECHTDYHRGILHIDLGRF